MDYVDDDGAAGGLGADEAQLVLGAVDEDDPGPQVERVAGLGPSAGCASSRTSRRNQANPQVRSPFRRAAPKQVTGCGNPAVFVEPADPPGSGDSWSHSSGGIRNSDT